MDIGQLIAVVIAIVIFVSVIPTLANTTVASTSTKNASPLLAGYNVTGASAALVDLVPLVFAAIGIVIFVKFISG